MHNKRKNRKPNNSNPNLRDNEFAVAIEILRAHPRMVMLTEVMSDTGHEPSFAHITDCYTNTVFANIPDHGESLAGITHGDILYTKDENGEFVPVAREVGGNMWIDVHFRVVAGFGDKHNPSSLKNAETFDILMHTDISKFESRCKIVHNSHSDVLDPDVFGDDIDDIARTSKIADAITRKYLQTDPDAKMLPKAFRRELAMQDFIDSMCNLVSDEVIEQFEQSQQAGVVPNTENNIEDFEVFSRKFS